ncbi:hypothetical protein QJS04_geneDACA021773 [Acorus gramineus]|uniref:VDE lipocalin domain-containing protein n=1 Tax=Acorus gramineus TaxID=55184 RepID=A0AAV9A464_ACOGR|nr:hypothetical protein QJS04_geneDACA021773 [Acorus gramineus]
MAKPTMSTSRWTVPFALLAVLLLLLAGPIGWAEAESATACIASCVSKDTNCLTKKCQEEDATTCITDCEVSSLQCLGSCIGVELSTLKGYYDNSLMGLLN